MAKRFVAISLFFAVCFCVADGKELLCRQLADGKELADGKLADSSSVMGIKSMMTYRTCRAGQLVPAVLGGVRP